LKKKWFILFILMLAFSASVLFIPIRKALVFQYENTNKILAFIPISGNQYFKIKFTHSIHLTDVFESYVITPGNQIKQYELEYEDTAIGMPSNSSEGEKFIMKDGKYYITNMNRIFQSFDLRIGQVRANHTVIFDGAEYPLANYIEPGTRVRIEVKKINLLQELEGVNILEHKN